MIFSNFFFHSPLDFFHFFASFIQLLSFFHSTIFFFFSSKIVYLFFFHSFFFSRQLFFAFFHIRDQYVKKPLPPPQVTSEVKLPPSLPFDSNSSYRGDFTTKPLPPIESPPEVKLPPSLPFDGNSHYRSDYTKKNMAVCQVTLMPPYPTPAYPVNHVFWDNNVKKWY